MDPSMLVIVRYRADRRVHLVFEPDSGRMMDEPEIDRTGGGLSTTHPTISPTSLLYP